MAIDYRSGNDPSSPKTISVYESSGTFAWKRPEGCTHIRVQLCGGGGGGSGYCEAGGAGGYSEKFIDCRKISEVQLTVGGGGGHTHYYGNSGDGGSSSFGNHLSATGGYGANRNTQHEGGGGGDGIGGDLNISGGKGSGHGNSFSSWGTNTGGRSFFGGGNGRRHSDNGDNTGQQLAAPGTGGTGGKTDASHRGSDGRTGIVIVHEYYGGFDEDTNLPPG